MTRCEEFREEWLRMQVESGKDNSQWSAQHLSDCSGCSDWVSKSERLDEMLKEHYVDAEPLSMPAFDSIQLRISQKSKVRFMKQLIFIPSSVAAVALISILIYTGINTKSEKTKPLPENVKAVSDPSSEYKEKLKLVPVTANIGNVDQFSIKKLPKNLKQTEVLFSAGVIGTWENGALDIGVKEYLKGSSKKLNDIIAKNDQVSYLFSKDKKWKKDSSLFVSIVKNEKGYIACPVEFDYDFNSEFEHEDFYDFQKGMVASMIMMTEQPTFIISFDTGNLRETVIKKISKDLNLDKFQSSKLSDILEDVFGGIENFDNSFDFPSEHFFFMEKDGKYDKKMDDEE